MAPVNKNGVPHGYASRVCCGVKDAMTEVVKHQVRENIARVRATA